MGEKDSINNKVPVKEGLFRSPSGESPYLIGSKCRACGEVFFPARVICRRCFKQDMEEMGIGQRGKLYTFTKILKTPIGSMIQAPYLVGKVEMPEGELIQTLLIDCDELELKVGMPMELVIDKIGKDEAGNEMLGYKYRPAKGGNE